MPLTAWFTEFYPRHIVEVPAVQEFIHEEEVEEIQRATRKRERILIAFLYACRYILAIFSLYVV